MWPLLQSTCLGIRLSGRVKALAVISFFIIVVSIWTAGRHLMETRSDNLVIQSPEQIKTQLLASYLKQTKLLDNRDGHRGALVLPAGVNAASEGQPAAILRHMKNRKNGTFFEAGAHDGVFQPSTLALEKDHGWTGMLVEPIPWMFDKLVATNRRAIMLQGCVSPKPYPYTAEMKVPRDSSAPSSHLDGEEVNTVTGEILKVECYPLIDILTAAGLRKLDVRLCLDVQGPELKILQTLPWNLVDFQLLVVENDHRDERKHQQLFNQTSSFLATQGYQFVERVAWDYFFMKRGL